jgi:hypothetical protein
VFKSEPINFLKVLQSSTFKKFIGFLIKECFKENFHCYSYKFLEWGCYFKNLYKKRVAAQSAATLFLCLSLCGDSYIPILEIVVILSRIKNQHKEGF